MVSIITPAYNNAQEVRKLLGSLSAFCQKEKSCEVIVVDDGTQDRSVKEAAERYPFARYIFLEKNSGVAAARNRGAREAKHNELLFLDSDIVVLHDTMEKVVGYFRNAQIKAFIGRFDMIPENNGFFPRYKAIMFNSWLPRTDWSTVVSPAFCAIRKDLFFESGGFDESIKGATVGWVRLSYELNKRCVIRYFPDTVVKVKLNSFRKALRTDFYATMKWVTIFSRYRTFDNHCTSVSGALGRLAGCAALLLLPLCVSYNLFSVWILLFMAYLVLNRRFFVLVLRRESFFFFLRSIATHVVMSTVTVFGGIAGLMLLIKKSISKDKTNDRGYAANI